jgi:hypothetical protein
MPPGGESVLTETGSFLPLEDDPSLPEPPFETDAADVAVPLAAEKGAKGAVAGDLAESARANVGTA